MNVCVAVCWCVFVARSVGLCGCVCGGRLGCMDACVAVGWCVYVARLVGVSLCV